MGRYPLAMTVTAAEPKHIPVSMNLRPELQTEDPIQLVCDWLQLAEGSEPNDPNAAALATASAAGVPSVRMVLVKKIDEHGFRFFTNADSQKGRELADNPVAALALHWKSLRRQIRAAGPIVSLPENITDEYFHSRSRRSQIAAAVSKQSSPLESRASLEQAVATLEHEVDGAAVPRPAAWRGYLLQPASLEFWIDGPDRLHDRLLFTRSGETWNRTLLYP
jgi:pyridoxamine 5'-phosphate oxidase